MEMRVNHEDCVKVIGERIKLYGPFENSMPSYAQCMEAVEIHKLKTYYAPSHKTEKQVAEMLRALIALKAARILTTPDSEVASIKDSYIDLANYLFFTKKLKYFEITLSPALFNSSIERPSRMPFEELCNRINSEGLFAKGVEYESL